MKTEHFSDAYWTVRFAPYALAIALGVLVVSNVLGASYWLICCLVLRRAGCSAARVPRASVRPEERLRELVSTQRLHTWQAVRSASGISSLPGLGWFSPRTIGDLTRWAVTHAAKEWKRPGETWTRSEIRSVVRAVVTDVTGVEDFGDDDDFIHKIAVD